MKPIKPVALSNLRKGSQFNLPGDPGTIWEVTEEAKHPGDCTEVMNLMSRRIFDDLPPEQDVFKVPDERRITLSEFNPGDDVIFTDAHYNITGRGIIENITYPEGQATYHIHQLKGCPPGFQKTYVCPSMYVGDSIKRVTKLSEVGRVEA